MPKLARDYKYNYRSYPNSYAHVVTPLAQPTTTPIKRQPRRKLKRKSNPLASLILLLFAVALGMFVIPFSFQRLTKPLFTNGISYPEVKMSQDDLKDFFKPTAKYVNNDLFLNELSLRGADEKNPEMTKLYMTNKMQALEANLNKLIAQYPQIDSTIFVWDYDSGKYVDIKGDTLYSTASIIKIPVLIELFKTIEANQFTIYDDMYVTPFYRSEGSGSLQFKGDGTKYSIDTLARLMITESDNTATNMLMSKVGGMPDVNQAVRRWGIKHTHVQTWLPDMQGTNYSTSRDLATMLYNLDNPSFFNINSRESIIDYMSHVKNNRLIQAGLPQDALFVHKTGDIGKMLGDAGIVYPSNGKKYIVVIMANRPYNSPLGKDFIEKASEIIYNGVTTGAY